MKNLKIDSGLNTVIKMSGRVTKTKTLLAKAEIHKVKNEPLALMEEGADRGIIRGGVISWGYTCRKRTTLPNTTVIIVKWINRRLCQ